MRILIIIIFLHISSINTIDYNINNEQICTHRPFVANFPHNCSRTRLTTDVQLPNRNDILFLTIIFRPKLVISDHDLSIAYVKNMSTSLTLIKSASYNQKIYLTFFATNERSMSINNFTKLSFKESTVNSYLYDTSLEELSPWKNSIDMNNASVCMMKVASFPPEGLTRAYYLYTNETDLIIDLSKSSSYISPLFNFFQACFTTETDIKPTAIVLIVLVCVFSVISVIILGICLRKQLKELYYIFTNWIKKVTGQNPIQMVDV
ncbi:hypothetical protein I4U23_018378 [Adineta vaga]|nr:hypothetical protein I4U23_018378 [Adineta vaga]